MNHIIKIFSQFLQTKLQMMYYIEFVLVIFRFFLKVIECFSVRHAVVFFVHLLYFWGVCTKSNIDGKDGLSKFVYKCVYTVNH